MTDVKKDDGRFGGEYLVQDSDHMSEIVQPSDKASRGSVRQSEQSAPASRQQGSGDNSAERRRRQAH